MFESKAFGNDTAVLGGDGNVAKNESGVVVGGSGNTADSECKYVRTYVHDYVYIHILCTSIYVNT